MSAYITPTPENIEGEHICCAFSDKKCAESYQLKKQWLTQEFERGYLFRTLDERAVCYYRPECMHGDSFWQGGYSKVNGSKIGIP